MDILYCQPAFALQASTFSLASCLADGHYPVEVSEDTRSVFWYTQALVTEYGDGREGGVARETIPESIAAGIVAPFGELSRATPIYGVASYRTIASQIRRQINRSLQRQDLLASAEVIMPDVLIGAASRVFDGYGTEVKTGFMTDVIGGVELNVDGKLCLVRTDLSIQMPLVNEEEANSILQSILSTVYIE